MKRFLVLLSAAAPLWLLAACGQPQLTVEAALPSETAGEMLTLRDLPVRLLPYDRDAIFDSLEQAAAEPEPAIPPEILAQQQAVHDAQTEWRRAEERWNTVRDSLRTVAQSMQRMEQQGLRATPQYRQAFEQFGRLESEERQVNQRMVAAFARFDELQRATLAQADSIRVVRDAWAERAFADYDRVVAARLKQMGRDEQADTTNSAGVATFRVPSGRWWVYARYTLPTEELYWNVPVEVTGDGGEVRLNRENAQVRPVL
jgi:hypothetical protein